MHLKFRDTCYFHHCGHFGRLALGDSGTVVGVRSRGVLCRLVPRDTLGGVAIVVSLLFVSLWADSDSVSDSDEDDEDDDDDDDDAFDELDELLELDEDETDDERSLYSGRGSNRISSSCLGCSCAYLVFL